MRASILMVLGLGMFLMGCSGVRPQNLGVKDLNLALCPATPNCVSSQSSDQEHFIAPLRFTGTDAAAWAKLKRVVLGMKRASIVDESGTYLHAEFTSLVWRFVDDVEFVIIDKEKLIHVRSASRLGKSDLGVNRKRIEEIRSRWNAAGG